MALQQDGHTYFDEQSFAPFTVVDEVVRSHEPEFAPLGFTLKSVMLEGPPPAIVFRSRMLAPTGFWMFRPFWRGRVPGEASAP